MISINGNTKDEIVINTMMGEKTIFGAKDGSGVFNRKMWKNYNVRIVKNRADRIVFYIHRDTPAFVLDQIIRAVSKIHPLKSDE